MSSNQANRKWAGRATHAEVNLDALAANVRAIKAWVGESVEVMAVVKANAYGLGAITVAGTALDSGAGWLGVACVDEGVQLRRAGFVQPIFVLGYAQPSEAGAVIAHHLTITVNSLPLAHALNNIAFQCRATAPVHLKLDSGLVRYGRPAAELEDLVRACTELRNLHLEGLYTHFASADEADHSFVLTQLERFLAMRDKLTAQGHRFAYYHAANSAATLTVPSSHLSLVRVGLALHGIYHSPATRTISSLHLQPVLTLRSVVARLGEVEPGDSVGYNRTWRANRPTLAATIPLGYADGYRRSLSNRGSVLVRGRRAPLIGRVSMDNIVVDVTNVPGVAEGDEVVLIGEQAGAAISIDELAEASGTISYEVSAGLAPRVPRLYYRGGTLLNATTLLGREDLSVNESLPGATPAPPPPSDDEGFSTALLAELQAASPAAAGPEETR